MTDPQALHMPGRPEAAPDGVAPPNGSQSIRPKALIFTLFGDYIRERGGEIWTGSLIHLMRRLGVPSAQAVRSTLSRMSQRGWLQSRKRGRRSYYSLTPRGQRLLDEGARRIFEGRPEARHWDGHWRLLSYHIPDDLTPLRARLRQELGWIGFGRLDSSLYVAPYDYAHELAALFDRLGIHEHVDLFVGEFRGPRSDADIARRAWDLAGIDSAYRTFLTTWQPFFARDRATFTNPSLPRPGPDACFVRRFMLLHEYRTFPFLDPDLPPALLPSDWKGAEARTLFHSYYELLAEPAVSFFESVFSAAVPDGEEEEPS